MTPIHPRRIVPEPSQVRRRILVGILGLATICCLQALPANAAIFTVGYGTNCDFNDLQVALWATWLNDISGPTEDEIRIARNQAYVGEFEIANQDVVLRGGYDHCLDTSPSGTTQILRPTGARHFRVDSSGGGRRTVRFEDLHLTSEQEAGEAGEYGGSLLVQGLTDLVLEDSIVELGKARVGGGIYLEGDATLSVERSLVQKNYAELGGGIACEKTEDFFHEDSGQIHLQGSVLYNKATLGGGIYVDGCEVKSSGSEAWTGLFFNAAVLDGGGLYATGPANSQLRSTFLQGNVATRGGGAFVTEHQAILHLSDSVVSSNTASADGGGLFAEDSGAIIMFSDLCGTQIPLNTCSLLENNRAERGGAAFVARRAGIHFYEARLTKNSARHGAVAFAENRWSDVWVLNSEVFDNEGDVLVELVDEGEFFGAHVTIGKNRPGTPGATWQFENGTAYAELHQSIFSDPTGVIHAGSVAPASNWTCLLVPSQAHDPGGLMILPGNPDFRDESIADYRLGNNSEAVDLCPVWPSPAWDRLGIFRVDLPYAPNRWGIADAGSLERVE